MHTIESLSSRIPISVVQNVSAPIPLETLAAQLHLNGWLGENLINHLLKDAQQCIITIFEGEEHPEAVISGIQTSRNEQAQFPGFYATRNKEEITIPHELQRAAAYIGKKYTPHLGIVKATPCAYALDNIKVDLKKKEATATIHPCHLDYATEQEYWDERVAPGISEPFDQGRAMRVLEEAWQHNTKSQPLDKTEQEKWAREMMQYSLYGLCEMMKQHGRKTVYLTDQKTNHGILRMSNIEYCAFYDPEICRKIADGEKEIRLTNLTIEQP